MFFIKVIRLSSLSYQRDYLNSSNNVEGCDAEVSQIPPTVKS